MRRSLNGNGRELCENRKKLSQVVLILPVVRQLRSTVPCPLADLEDNQSQAGPWPHLTPQSLPVSISLQKNAGGLLGTFLIKWVLKVILCNQEVNVCVR